MHGTLRFKNVNSEQGVFYFSSNKISWEGLFKNLRKDSLCSGSRLTNREDKYQVKA